MTISISLADALKQNSPTGAEALPKDLPTGFDWYKGYLKQAPAPPSFCTAMTGYGHLYPIAGTTNMTNPAIVIELRNIESYVRLRATKAWVQVQNSGSIDGAHFIGDFSGNAAINMQLNKLASGTWTMDFPPSGYNNHWWPRDRGTYAAGSIDGAYTIQELRVTDPAANDRLIAGSGIDWWRDAGIGYAEPVGTNNPASGIGCWVKLTTTFRPVCFYSFIDDSVFTAALPPGVGTATPVPTPTPTPTPLPVWSVVDGTGQTSRLVVPNGWLYRTNATGAIVFVHS